MRLHTAFSTVSLQNQSINEKHQVLVHYETLFMQSFPTFHSLSHLTHLSALPIDCFYSGVLDYGAAEM